MLVNGCFQPILMIGKIRTSPSRMVGLFSLANYTVLPWRLKRTYNFATNCSETDSLVDRAEDCNVRGSRFESLAKHFYINDSCNCITFDFKYIPSHSWESNLSFSRLLGLSFFFFFLRFWIFFFHFLCFFSISFYVFISTPGGGTQLFFGWVCATRVSKSRV